MKQLQTKVVVMLDMVGSSASWSTDPIGTLKVLTALGRRVQALADTHGGMLVKAIGDAYMLAFDDLAHSIFFAIQLQSTEVPAITRSIRKARPRAQHLWLRIGICEGPVQVVHPSIQGCRLVDFLGNTVNTAARLESMLSPHGGFAVAVLGGTRKRDGLMRVQRILNRHPITAAAATDASVIVKARATTSDVPSTTPGLRRSGRLIPWNIQMRDVRDFHGVAAFDALVFKL